MSVEIIYDCRGLHFLYFYQCILYMLFSGYFAFWIFNLPMATSDLDIVCPILTKAVNASYAYQSTNPLILLKVIRYSSFV